MTAATPQPPPASDLECKVCEQATSPHGTAPVIVYVSIGNSDDKLTQAERSCGKCIRGLLCTGCNVQLGWYEKYAPEVAVYLAAIKEVMPL